MSKFIKKINRKFTNFLNRRGKTIKDRYEFPKLIDERHYKYLVEVGAARCGFANFLLTNAKSIEKYYAIDPWSQIAGDYKCSIESAKENLKEHIDKVEFLQMTSMEALHRFEDESVDFIYIDALHTYDEVMEDMACWWKKLKVGGVMGGHDYCHYQPGVIKAVNEFVENNKLALNITGVKFPGEFADADYGGMEGDSESWWIVK